MHVYMAHDTWENEILVMSWTIPDDWVDNYLICPLRVMHSISSLNRAVYKCRSPNKWSDTFATLARNFSAKLSCLQNLLESYTSL